jgi:hypothetical protein
MAVAILSGGLTSLRGREGGTVFYRDPRGPEYVRLRAWNPHPRRAHTPEQQHTCAGMQAAMIAYRVMIGGPFEPAWQSLALAQLPVAKTIDYFCSRNLTAWKLGQGPSVDPSFPGVISPTLLDSISVSVPDGSHGIADITCSFAGPPAAVLALCITASLTGILGPSTASTYLVASYTPYLDVIKLGIRLSPGLWYIGGYPVANDGSWPYTYATGEPVEIS